MIFKGNPIFIKENKALEDRSYNVVFRFGKNIRVNYLYSENYKYIMHVKYDKDKKELIYYDIANLFDFDERLKYKEILFKRKK